MYNSSIATLICNQPFATYANGVLECFTQHHLKNDSQKCTFNQHFHFVIQFKEMNDNNICKCLMKVTHTDI